MYSIHNEGKSVVAERFIRILENKIFKYMTAISKNIYFDVLDDIVNKYNNTVHRTVKMKSTDVTDNSYAEYNDNFNRKDPKFKVINDRNGEKIIGTFYEKELQKTNQEEFRIEKEKVINYMWNGKGMIIYLIVGLIKKTLYKKWVNTFLNRLEVLEEI